MLRALEVLLKVYESKEANLLFHKVQLQNSIAELDRKVADMELNLKLEASLTSLEDKSFYRYKEKIAAETNSMGIAKASLQWELNDLLEKIKENHTSQRRFSILQSKLQKALLVSRNKAEALQLEEMQQVRLAKQL